MTYEASDNLIKYLTLQEAQTIINSDERRKRGIQEGYYLPVGVHHEETSEMLRNILIDRMKEVHGSLSKQGD